MRFHLTNAPLFRGMTPEEIDALLSCLNAKARACKKSEIILMEGAPTEQLGVVLSGRVIIEMSDVWGNNSVLSSVAPAEPSPRRMPAFRGSRSWSTSSPRRIRPCCF